MNRARARGHEIMLQVPMEPVGYPGNNPGPKTLLTERGEEANIDVVALAHEPLRRLFRHHQLYGCAGFW